jgi:enoyl-CoA hydratase
MAYNTILTEKKDFIFIITINRPDKLNALNKATIREIGEAVRAAENDPGTRVIILTGSGNKAFVAGADISEFSNFSEAEGARLAQDGHDVFNSVERCSKPVIASNAKFGQPEVKLGLIPGYGGTQRLPQLIGKTKALELLMTADMLNADEALQLGLVNHVTSPDTLLEKCLEIAGKIAQQAPMAVAGIIRSVNASYDKNSDGYKTEVTEFGKCFITEDFTEGTTAFLEKRKPAFKGK